MAKKKQQTIDLEEQRYGMFMTENSFDLDVEYGRNFIMVKVLFFTELTLLKPNHMFFMVKPKQKIRSI